MSVGLTFSKIVCATEITFQSATGPANKGWPDERKNNVSRTRKVMD